MAKEDTASNGVGLDTLQINSSGLTANGTVAQRLLACGMNVNGLRTNDTLRKDEWLQYDRTIVDIARTRLVAVGDLMAAGLTFPLVNALGTTVVQWEKVSDMSPANTDMSGLTEGERDRVDFSLVSVPVPITHKGFQINIRALEASRKNGESLDTTQSATSSRLVADALESMLMNGITMTHGGGTIYGYTNFPSRNTGSLTATWATGSGADIVTDVLDMIDALVADNMYGPYMIYVPKNAYTHLADDYKANSDRTIIERILAIPGVSGVKPQANLAAQNVVVVQMTKDVVDMVTGMQPTMVQWDSHGGMMFNFKVMSIMVPRLKADYDGRCGIAHFS